ncbi:MAG: AAA domain-containing protein, partial [Succinivibrionaceae bacterium]|nr:AAA domain-containing protein [Succinivibrionaceae bacterium]
MNSLETEYFSELSKDRAESAKVLKKRSIIGIWNSVVEKYSDQAHFIYELLQNADDAQAVNARFVLEHDRLIFAHDGARHFSVSNPANEDKDSEQGRLGDINSITSIANSTKTESSIGKFGVGFKAVFQYTKTPRIYDPEFRFEIDDYIVPNLISDDIPERRQEETLFEFPFNHPDRDESAAYVDISKKLKNLVFPLLFLSHLDNIEFTFGGKSGNYRKTIEKTLTFGDTDAEKILLSRNDGDKSFRSRLWLFSRTYDGEHRYSVGYFLDDKGHLTPIKRPAFCFFTTKEATGLRFMIHAPFQLTDSREGIRAGVKHNERMIDLLASLSADALSYLREIGQKESARLIDDGIVNIIPVDPETFSDPDDKDRISFLPFYTAIKKKLEEDELLPAKGGYVSSENAYWAQYPVFTELFSNEQLGDIVGNSSAKWVFPTISRDKASSNRPLISYIDSIIKTSLNEESIIMGRSYSDIYAATFGQNRDLVKVKGITAKFIEKQPVTWLHQFYKWMSETSRRKGYSKRIPIFLDQDGHAAAAYDRKDNLILFLPVPGTDMSGYRVVSQKLLDNKETKEFLLDLGVKQPSLRDQIYNTILPQYEKGGEIDTDSHFRLFFAYFLKCPNDEVDDFIESIKDLEFLTYRTKEDDQTHRGAADSMYLADDDLRSYFETKPDTRFIEIDDYRKLTGNRKEDQLLDFLERLGVQKVPVFKDVKIKDQWSRHDLPRPNYTQYREYSETIIDGCKEIIENIIRNSDKEKSVLLWKVLVKIIQTKLSDDYYSEHYNPLDNKLMGICRYFYRTAHLDIFVSSDAVLLKTAKWLVAKDGSFVSASEIWLSDLPDAYDTHSGDAPILINFLGLKEAAEGPEGDNSPEEEEDDSNLTDRQREEIGLARQLKEAGINSPEELQALLELKKERDAEKAAREALEKQQQIPQPDEPGGPWDGLGPDGENAPTGQPGQKGTEESGNEQKKHGSDRRDQQTKKKIWDEIARLSQEDAGNKPINDPEDGDGIDSDPMAPSPVDYGRRIDRAKEKSAAELNKIAHLEELQRKALTAPTYSYGWFSTLLEMESLSNAKDSSNGGKEVSISFSLIEREPGTERTLVLKHPNRYIPQFMEELADIPMILHMGDMTKTVAIEVASVRSYTLRVKMKNATAINGIDLSSVNEVSITAQSPAFLLEELRKQFIRLGEKLNLTDDYDMQKNLCENIEFIFGPPGTGKTTYLAKNVLRPLMSGSGQCRVLVLTPTNKAADVLVHRVMETAVGSRDYEKWLIRFGATGDEEIEQSPVFKEKDFNILSLEKSITVTTIARFPYDYFMADGKWIFLNGVKWDYIVIDEASMIPLVNIVYPLYCKTPRKFI